MNAESNIVELINIKQDVTWIAWGVQYFFLIAMSYGAFLLTLPHFVFGKAQFEKLARLALLVAITCGIAAPIALISDLHQPARFYNFYLHFTPGSWMSWGAFFLPIYVVLLMVYAWLIYRPAMMQQAKNQFGLVARLTTLLAFGGTPAPAAIKKIGLLTLVAATLVALYTGAEVSIIATRPLWHTPMMPLLFVVTGISGATGLSLILNRLLTDNDLMVNQQLSKLLVNSLGLTLLLQFIWYISGVTGLSQSGIALQRLATEYNPASFTLLWLVICTITPLMLALLKPQPTVWVTGLLTIAGAWLFRWSMFIDGQRIPKTGAGFYDYPVPLGTEGLLGILGTVGLWVFLVLLITSFLPWQGEKQNAAV
jgi:tetrathionate reductase subunit C